MIENIELTETKLQNASYINCEIIKKNYVVTFVCGNCVYNFLNKDNPYVLSFAVKPFGYEDEDIIIANTKRAINRAWALAGN